ncbi:hypothetical protein [Sphingomonas sp.]|nr:hypothetical protein [Sphingomonas sp.]MBA4763308.1 hypothetical protein [Sphingomonas sp.]
MSDLANRTTEPVASDARATWSDPVCTEYAVDELTQAGAFGGTDGGIFS